MTKAFYSVVLICLASAIAQYFLPWWSSVIICAIVAWIFKLGRVQAWTVGFLSIFLLWYGMSFYADRQFDVPMSTIIGNIFGGISPSLTYILTGVCGAIPAGLGAWIGASFSDLIPQKSKKSRKGYYKFS
jgi:hypothetical protein